MALRIPDIVLINTINMCLKIARTNYNTNNDSGREHRSILALLFKGLVIGEYDVFENIKKLVLTTPEDPRHIEAQLSYDHNASSNAPIIWITLPSENNRNNSLSTGEGDQEPLYLAGEEGGQDSFLPQYNYRFGTTYQIVLGSINKNEVTLLYHLIKSLLVSCIGHLEQEGISNLKIGGGEIRTAAIPSRFFTKAITLNFEYEQVIPETASSLIYRKIRLFSKPIGATVASGPIEISTEDNINSDFDSES
jgi:hypothetical protein